MVGINRSSKRPRDSRLGGSQIFGAPRDQILRVNIGSLGEFRLAAVSRAVTKCWNRFCARDDAKNEVPAAQRSFAQPTACLHMPAKLTPELTKHEGRKPRASERHAVGCSEELGGRSPAVNATAIRN